MRNEKAAAVALVMEFIWLVGVGGAAMYSYTGCTVTQVVHKGSIQRDYKVGGTPTSLYRIQPAQAI